jgi:hypothetical protein
VSPPTPTPRPKQRRRWIARAALATVVAAVAACIAVPYEMVARGTHELEGCFASYRTRKAGSATPSCMEPIHWYVWPSRIPWTEHAASYRAEEAFARSAFYDYLDAAVGKPDRATLTERSGNVEREGAKLKVQSRRVVIEELGPPIGAPDVGKAAVSAGDRATLLARSNDWLDWSVRMHTLEAALVEGKIERAITIAKHYATFDPRDEDLRARVAALLCAGGEAQRAVNFLKLLQDERAKERHESFARDYGDVRWLMLACAASKPGVDPAPKPERTDAGRMDREGARAVLRIRLAKRRSENDPSILFDAAQATIDELKLERDVASHGLLLPALVASGYTELGTARVAELASDDEPDDDPTKAAEPGSLAEGAALRALTTRAWLGKGPDVEPMVPPEELALAGDRIGKISEEKSLSSEQREALSRASSRAWLGAARGRALAGLGEGAALAVDAATAVPEPLRLLARVSSFRVAGDDARALAISEPAVRSLPSIVRAAIQLERAEMLASAGRASDAAAAAIDADESASKPGAPTWLIVSARMTRLAFGGDKAVRDDDAARGGELLRAPTPRVLPWLAPLEAPLPSTVAVRGYLFDPLARTAILYRDARASSTDDKLALRYAALAHRGDVPHAYVAALSLAADLLPQDGGDREVWLDTVTAFDRSLISLRGYAFARRAVASARGDKASAARWNESFKALTAFAIEPDKAEIARFLGI